MDTCPDHHHYHQTPPKIPGNSPDVLLGLVQRKGTRVHVFVASFSVEHLIFSRAHTIVGVTFTQKRKNEAGEETAKTSLINLVDLAGRWVIAVSFRINSFGCLMLVGQKVLIILLSTPFTPSSHPSPGVSTLAVLSIAKYYAALQILLVISHITQSPSTTNAIFIHVPLPCLPVPSPISFISHFLLSHFPPYFPVFTPLFP